MRVDDFMEKKSSLREWVILGLVLWSFTACSAETESPGQGTCALKCSTPKAAASNFTVRLLNDVSSMESKCLFPDAQTPSAPQNGPVQLRFLVVETVQPFSTVLGTTAGGAAAGGGAAGGGAAGGGAAGGGAAGGGAAGGGAAGGGAAGGGAAGGEVGGALQAEVPKAGIGFEPFVYGQVAVEKSVQGYNPTDKSVTPFKYAGVVTPPTEWCTDTCGVATVEVWPLCIRGSSNSVKAGIFMEGVSKIPSVTIVTDGN
jgi:hypothetical protein